LYSSYSAEDEKITIIVKLDYYWTFSYCVGGALKKINSLDRVYRLYRHLWMLNLIRVPYYVRLGIESCPFQEKWRRATSRSIFYSTNLMAHKMLCGKYVIMSLKDFK
jgi:hypothetical protein